MRQTSYLTGVLGLLAAIALIQPSIATDPIPAFLISQANNNCRQVITENRLPFYLILPANRNEQSAIANNLAFGEQVGLANSANAVRGGDGELYVRVFFPYNRSNPEYGYVPARYQNRNGTLTSTLGYCGRKARW